MLTLNRRTKGFVTLDEIYFAGSYQTAGSNADISMFVMCGNCAPVKHKLKKGLIVDLTLSEEEILEQIHRTHKKYIRSSARDGLFEIKRTIAPGKEDIEEFLEYFNRFSRNKGIYTLDAKHFQPYLDTNCLVMTKTLDKQGNILVYHTYIHDGVRVSSQYSCSHFRLSEDHEFHRLISTSTKYSHYSNMCYFRSLGLQKYDFGGLRLTPEGEPESGIDQMKLGFGGTIADEYCFFFPRTALGKLALSLHPKDPSVL